MNLTGLDHQRDAARVKLFQPTTIQIGAEEHRAHLLDLSGSGALVHAEAAPAVGCTVLIDCAGGRRSARVVWQRGRRFGVRFAFPLLPALVARVVAGDC